MSIRAAIVVSLLAGCALLGASSTLDVALAKIAHAAGAGPAYRAGIARDGGEAAWKNTERIVWDGATRIARTCADGICHGTYFDGDRAFDLDANDVPLPLGPEAAANLRTLASIETHAFALPAFRDQGGTVADVTPADAALDERKLAVTAKDGAMWFVDVDASTNLVRRAAARGAREDLRYGAYERVGAVEVALERTGSSTATYMPFTPDVVATHPRGLAVRDTDTAAEPFALPDRRPYFACTAGGLPARCLLDTGSGGLAVSLRIAERLNLMPHGTVIMTGMGSYVTGFVEIPSLELPGVRVGSALYAVAHDLDLHGCDIVVGADILASTIARIDFAHRTLRFRMAKAEPPTGPTIPIRFGARVPYVEAQVSAQPAHLVLDTGDDSIVNLAAHYFARYAPFAATPASRREGTGGSSAALGGSLERLAVGELKQGPVYAIVTDRLRGDGHLGSGFFAGTVLELDYAHERIVATK